MTLRLRWQSRPECNSRSSKTDGNVNSENKRCMKPLKIPQNGHFQGLFLYTVLFEAYCKLIFCQDNIAACPVFFCRIRWPPRDIRRCRPYSAYNFFPQTGCPFLRCTLFRGQRASHFPQPVHFSVAVNPLALIIIDWKPREEKFFSSHSLILWGRSCPF